jgi:hypothetical protein
MFKPPRLNMMETAIKCSVVMLLSLLGVVAAFSQEAAIKGGAVHSCGDFANAYRSNTIAEDLWFQWAEGFMSGLNTKQITINGNSQNLNSISDQEQKSFIRRYCNEHPLDDYVSAVLILYRRLSPNKTTKTQNR